MQGQEERTEKETETTVVGWSLCAFVRALCVNSFYLQFALPSKYRNTSKVKLI